MAAAAGWGGAAGPGVRAMEFRFANVVGGAYRGGACAAGPGGALLCPSGARVVRVDLRAGSARALDLELRRPVRLVAACPAGALLLAVDEAGGVALANLRREAVLHRFSLKSPVEALQFCPARHRCAPTRPFPGPSPTPSPPAPGGGGRRGEWAGPSVTRNCSRGEPTRAGRRTSSTSVCIP